MDKGCRTANGFGVWQISAACQPKIPNGTLGRSESLSLNGIKCESHRSSPN